MKKILNGVGAVLGLALAVSCSSASDPKAAGPTEGNALASPAKVIQGLSLGTVELPASLRKSASTTSGSKGLVITDPATLPAVKGGYYFTMVDNLTGINMIDSMLTMLKSSPAVTGNAVALNGVTATGTVELLWKLNGSPVTASLPASGSLKTALSTDGKALEIWWKLSYPNPLTISSITAESALQEALNDTKDRVQVNLYFKVTSDGAVEVWAQAGSFGLKEHTTYNPATKALKNAQIASGRPYIQSVTPLPNGVLQFWSSNESQVVAGQANASLGALVMSNSNASSNWTGAEFYGSDASLLVQYNNLNSATLDFAHGTTLYPVRALTLNSGVSFAWDATAHTGEFTQGTEKTTTTGFEFQTWNPVTSSSESLWAPVVSAVPTVATLATDITDIKASLVGLWTTASAAKITDYLSDFDTSWAIIQEGFPQ